MTVTPHMGRTTVVFHHKISGETGYARVEQPYRTRFEESCKESASRGWCPLLRTGDIPGIFHCAIYEDRPAFCRNFTCCIMKVMSAGGDEIGSVTGRLSLSTKNNMLRVIWNTVALENKETGDEHQWRRNMKLALEKQGYIVELYD